MRHAIGFALVVGLGCALAGCRSGAPKEAPVVAPDMAIKDVKVVWTRGGKLGYLKSYDVVAKDRNGKMGPEVTIHYVEDLDFRRVGWVSDDGQAERYDYPPTREAEARRVTFNRVTLPPGSIEDQVRRILQVEPTTEIAFQRANGSDFQR